MAIKRIDFKFVKAQADFLLVLKHYHIEVLGSGVSRTIRCPFHQEKKASCKINLGRKIFHCFGCDAQGNILEFVRRKEGLEENDLRAAARKLAAICDIPTAPPQDGSSGQASERAIRPVDVRSPLETIKGAVRLCSACC